MTIELTEIPPETSKTELTGKVITKSEIKSAIKSMRNGKSTGNDKISQEMINFRHITK